MIVVMAQPRRRLMVGCGGAAAGRFVGCRARFARWRGGKGKGGGGERDEFVEAEGRNVF